MNAPQLEIICGRIEKSGKRLVIASLGHKQHRDILDTDNAFARSKFREAVVSKFALGDDAHEHVEALLFAQAEAADSEPAEVATPRVTTLASVEAKQVEWLWPGYFPRGAMVDLSGDPDAGKSQCTIELCGRVTTGAPMPFCDAPRQPADVLLVCPEDDAARVIVPRLNAVGADLSRCHLLECVDTFDGRERGVRFPDDWELVDKLVRQHRAAMIIIDPQSAVFAPGLSTNSDTDIRTITNPGKRIAEETRATILWVRHLNKKQGGSAMYRGTGSIAWVAAMRSAFAFAKSPDDPDTRIMANVKSNLGPKPRALTYSIESHGDTSRVVWGCESDHEADDLLGGGEKPDTKQGQAESIIERVLREGPTGERTVLAECETVGISKRTYWRARKRLGVLSEKTEFGGGEWLLRLPAEPTRHEEFDEWS